MIIAALLLWNWDQPALSAWFMIAAMLLTSLWVGDKLVYLEARRDYPPAQCVKREARNPAVAFFTRYAADDLPGELAFSVLFRLVLFGVYSAAALGFAWVRPRISLWATAVFFFAAFGVALVCDLRVI